MSDVFEVQLSRQAEKDLQKVPNYIKEKLNLWIELVELLGLVRVREIKGYHDEPLLGFRLGQRSIRLNKSYRAFYIRQADKSVEFIEVTEVNKHEY